MPYPSQPAARLHRAAVAGFLRDAQPESLINTGRLITSSFALIAIYLDPTHPATNVEETYAILGAYVAFALGLTLIPTRRPLNHPMHAIATAIDIVALGLLAAVSEELDSPFFVFFTFALITTTIRWGWRGVLTTALALQVEVLLVAVPDMRDGVPELNILVLRSAYCWVAAVILGYFGSYRDRSHSRLTELASWPFEVIMEEERPWLASSLRHASHILGTDRVIVIWQDHDRQTGEVAYWTGSDCHFASGLDLCEWISTYVADDAPSHLSTRGRKEALGALQAILNPALEGLDEGIDPDSSAIYPAYFESLRYRGSVIVIDPQFQNEDVLSLTRIVASRIVMELEQFAFIDELAAAASLKERIRLSRDLHDSVLQDLTAAALQLDAAAKRLPHVARGSLAEVRDLILKQQRQIRRFVTDVRPPPLAKQYLVDQLQPFVGPLGRQWDCGIEIHVEPSDLRVDDHIATEICLLLSEATANAVRHGNAAHVDVEIGKDGDHLRVAIRDDGSGFCDDSRVPVPYSLNARTEQLGGDLTILNTRPGLMVTMDIPLDRGAA